MIKAEKNLSSFLLIAEYPSLSVEGKSTSFIFSLKPDTFWVTTLYLEPDFSFYLPISFIVCLIGSHQMPHVFSGPGLFFWIMLMPTCTWCFFHLKLLNNFPFALQVWPVLPSVYYSSSWNMFIIKNTCKATSFQILSLSSFCAIFVLR